MQATQKKTVPQSLQGGLLQVGAMYFYGPDPSMHSPVVVREVGELVTGFSHAKDMELSYAPGDLIDAGQMAEETISHLQEQRSPHWQEMVAARIRCMADTIAALQRTAAEREAMAVGRIESLVTSITNQKSH